MQARTVRTHPSGRHDPEDALAHSSSAPFRPSGMTPAPTVVSWSSGKDSCWTLRAAASDPALEVVGLLTSFNGEADRVAMHAVRRGLVEAQADRLGLPLHTVDLPYPCPNGDYERLMGAAVASLVGDGVERVAFGDIFLADVRAYREEMLAGTRLEPVFPLWGAPTRELAHAMVDGGVRAVLTCVDPARVPASYAGRPYDAALLADLPPGVDPCGEHGEFHTFVWDGPGFRDAVPVALGASVERDGFVFRDLTAAG